MSVRVVRGFGGLMGTSSAEAEDQLPVADPKAPEFKAPHDDEERSGFIKLAQTPLDDS